MPNEGYIVRQPKGRLRLVTHLLPMIRLLQAAAMRTAPVVLSQSKQSRLKAAQFVMPLVHPAVRRIEGKASRTGRTMRKCLPLAAKAGDR